MQMVDLEDPVEDQLGFVYEGNGIRGAVLRARDRLISPIAGTCHEISMNDLRPAKAVKREQKRARLAARAGGVPAPNEPARACRKRRGQQDEAGLGALAGGALEPPRKMQAAELQGYGRKLCIQLKGSQQPAADAGHVDTALARGGRVGLARNGGAQALADPLQPPAALAAQLGGHRAGSPGRTSALARLEDRVRAAAAAEGRHRSSVLLRTAAAAAAPAPAAGQAECMRNERAAATAAAAGAAVAPCAGQASPATLRRADTCLTQASQLLQKAMLDLGEDFRKAREQYAEKEAALKQQLAAAEAARDEANQKIVELKQQLTQAEADRKTTSAGVAAYRTLYLQLCVEKREVLKREVQQKEQLVQLQKEKAEAVQREQALEKEKAEAVQREQQMQREKAEALQREQKMQKEKAEALQREQQMQRQLDEEVLCQICMEHKRDTVLMPCLHFLYCHGCIQGQTARAGAAAAAGGGGGGAVAAAGGAGVSRGQQQRGGRGGAAAAAPTPLLPCPACRMPITGHLVALLASR